ncbi:MAG: cellulase family glycosylhydrolase [Planctomycetaceae bacterium]|nr:cellulase family glycosylhydrolase [Planctomycetaceae bacterium]
MKLYSVLALLCLVLLTAEAYSWNEWNYAGGSHLWSNSANWSPRVPLNTDDPIMRGQGLGNEALIDSTVTARGRSMWIGYSGRADLVMTGGSLNLTGGFRLGQSGGNGNAAVSGGTVSIGGDIVIGDGGSGIGNLTMTGGIFNHVSGWIYVGYSGASGTVNLNGDVLITSKVVMGSGSAHMNITQGKLVITNTDAVGVANEMYGYMAAGQLTFYNGDPRATYAFTVNTSGHTEITASLPNAEYAWNPTPPDLSAGVGLNASLSWSVGVSALSHDVYFGTSYDAVNAAARIPFDFDVNGVVDIDDTAAFAQQWLSSSADFDFDQSGSVDLADFADFACRFYTQAPPEFRGNQTAASFMPPTMNPNMTYYWRLDEVLDSGIYKGPVWRFSTGPIIVAAQTDNVSKYDPVFIDIGTSASCSNPYNPDDIRMDAIILQPGGAFAIVPCFYVSGGPGNSRWQCRYTPRLAGAHSYWIDVYQASVLTMTSDVFTLDVIDSAKDGFLRINPSSHFTFMFDSGRRFRGIGENIGWEQGGYTYDRLFPLLNTLGCNYVRVMMSNPYNVPLEGTTDGLGRYNQSISQRLDNAVNLAQQSGIHLTISFDMSSVLDAASTDPTMGWALNPYNAANGGMCASPTDFFTSAAAKAQYKKKLRYIVARWGYSPNVAAFEFWNEIDAAIVHYGVPQSNIVSWHNEMTPYIKSIDPFGHSVTTSCTGYETTGFWDMPAIDFSQTHPYRNQWPEKFDPSQFPTIIQSTYEARYGKPHVLGEFGYTSGEPRDEPHSAMVDGLHRGLWYGMFSATPILPQTWWWDYFEQNGDNYQFSAAATFLAEMMRDNAELTVGSANAGSSVETLAVTAGHDRFAWLRNKMGYSVGPTLTISGLPNGTYIVKYYNTSTGQWYNQQTKSVTSGTLTSSIGTLTAYQDAACWIAPQQ